MVTIQKEWHFMGVYLKVNADIAERLDTRCSNPKIEEIKLAGGGYATGGIHIKQNFLKPKKWDSRLNNNNDNPFGNSNYGNRDRENYESQYMVFTAISDAERLEDDIWICDSGASSHYCSLDRGMSDFKNINENIQVGNGDFLTATKIGSPKCKVIQIDGTTFNIILHDVKFVPGLWENLFCINQAIRKAIR
jgi:hypothetical protein